MDDLRVPHPYLSGNFAPVQETRRLTPCAYTGRIPLDLAGGQYVRNGGNPITNGDIARDSHWFDGDGMLSGVLFRRVDNDKKGQILPHFVNQFLITDVYAYARTSPRLVRPVLPSIATLVNPLVSALVIVGTVLRTVLLVLFSHLSAKVYPIRKISVANTAVLFHDGRALATCESGPPLRFALPELQTVGWYNGHRSENEPMRKTLAHNSGSGDESTATFGGGGPLSFMREWTTAHPRVDPITNELLAFHSIFIKPFVFYSIIPAKPATSSKPAGSKSASLSLPVRGVKAPKMMHDFGVSREHTVILDLPLTLDPSNLARGQPVLSYDSGGRSRFGVFPRYAPDAIRWFETAACVIFHTANCWTTTHLVGPHKIRETLVNLVACRLTSASLVFSAGNLPTPETKPIPPEYAEEEQCRLYYYSFPFSGDTTDMTAHIRHQWALSAISFEFPTMSPRHSMQEARYMYGCTTGTGSYTVALGKAAKIDYLAKVDVLTLIAKGIASPPQSVRGCVDTRTVPEVLQSADPRDPIKLFQMPPGWYAQEPRFVPRVNPRMEDDGWLLTYVFDESQLDERTGDCLPDAQSELWIIDAQNMSEVVAKVKLPQRVPYGLHGNWFSEYDIANQRPIESFRELDESPGRSSVVQRWIESWLG